MGRINDFLKHEGYNLKERAYIIGGSIAGAVAPIAGARYLLFPETDSIGGEALAWSVSLIANASTMIVEPHLPIPAYTGSFGMVSGTLLSNSSRGKRIRESRLEEASENGE